MFKVFRGIDNNIDNNLEDLMDVEDSDLDNNKIHSKIINILPTLIETHFLNNTSNINCEYDAVNIAKSVLNKIYEDEILKVTTKFLNLKNTSFEKMSLRSKLRSLKFLETEFMNEDFNFLHEEILDAINRSTTKISCYFDVKTNQWVKK